MSTIKSSDEHLTLNADGSGNDIKFQSNGTEVASISDGGVVTATSFNGSGANLTGIEVDGISSSADATAITIDSSENVGIGVTPESWNSSLTALQIGETGAISGGDTAWGGYLEIGSNFYRDSGGFKYTTADKAVLTEYDNNNGKIVHKVAGSSAGSADAAITWLDAVTINNRGQSVFRNEDNIDDFVLNSRQLGSSYGGNNSLVYAQLGRDSNAAVRLFCGSSNINSSQDIEYNLRSDGTAYADGSWQGGGADYAEYFEWKDGNPSDEDRRGYSVVLDGDKIVKATEGQTPIGVISGRPAVVGDADIDDKWKKKYLKDDYGTVIMETYTVISWTDDKGNEVWYASDAIPDGVVVPDDAVTKITDNDNNEFKRRKRNPDWNEDTPYVMRENRKEWSTVGLMGKLRIRKGQPTASNWIKMRDVSDTVEEWLVK